MNRMNMLDYFSETLCEHDADVAVVDGERKFTFAELREMAFCVSGQIKNKTGNITNKPVAVFLPKSFECVMSDLGILMSGNAFMNLDVNTPGVRVEAILSQVRPILLITDKKHLVSLEQVDFQCGVLCVDEYEEGTFGTRGDVSSEPQNQLYPEVLIDTDPMCIINTSGSTGTPKSVVLNHRSFIDFTEWAMNHTRISKREIIGSLSPVVFDIYCFELCMMMSLGCRIVLIPDKLAAFPAKILELLNVNAVTYLFWVPTIMVNIANMNLLARIPLPSVKHVWFAGEVFPTKQFNIWKNNLPDAQFINLYGPIEITLDCTYYIVDRALNDDEPIPIGFPCRNTDILILTEDDKPAKAGEEGELCVRGTSLAMGYYNDSKKTALAFTQNPLNTSYPEIIYRTGDIVCENERGEIMFRGRKDTLIKHSGYRVELAEIEHVIINTLQIVDNGAVMYDYDQKRIIFFYENESELTMSDFRKRVAKALPSYMIPTVLKKEDELPRNTNGKIDRLMLKGVIANG